MTLRVPPPQLFTDAIKLAVAYKQNSEDFMDEVLKELDVRAVGGRERRLLGARGSEGSPLFGGGASQEPLGAGGAVSGGSHQETELQVGPS